MGRFPRKCKLRGPSRVTSGYPPGTLRVPCTFRRGLIWKIRQNSDFVNKNPAKFGQNLSKLAKFGEKISKFSAIFDENFEH